MSDLEVFEVSIKESEDDGEVGQPVTVPIRVRDAKGEVVEETSITFSPPNSSQAALITMKLSFGGKRRYAEVLSLMGLILRLVKDPDEREWIESHLADDDDPTFTIVNFTTLLERVVEKWYARPTDEPSGSSQPQRTTGKKSTGQRHRKGSSHSNSARSAS